MILPLPHAGERWGGGARQARFTCRDDKGRMRANVERHRTAAVTVHGHGRVRVLESRAGEVGWCRPLSLTSVSLTSMSLEPIGLPGRGAGGLLVLTRPSTA